MLRIKRNAALTILVCMIAGILALLLKLQTMCLFVAITQLVLIVLCAKVSFFSIFAFLINFCLLQEYFAFLGWRVRGILEVSAVPIYFYEMYICVFTLNTAVLFIVNATNFLVDEERLVSANMDLGFQTSVVITICAVLITLLIFPSFPSLSRFGSGNRFHSGFLSLRGWSCIPFFFLSVAVMNKRCRKIVVLSIAFVVFWYAFHGERVDSIGLIALLAIKYYKEKRGDKWARIKLVLFGSAIVILYVAIGMLRGGTGTINMSQILREIFVQATACDVTYVFNCAVDLAKRGEHLYGITYLSYLINCVPFVHDPYLFQSYIAKYYFSPGGGLFFAEPIANFGIPFACLFSVLYLFFIARVVRKATKYRYMLYAALCISIFRSAWYGLNYPIITILYFIPAVLILSDLLKIKRPLHSA